MKREIFLPATKFCPLYRSDGLGIISVCILSVLAILIKLEDKARLAFTPEPAAA